MRHWPLEEEIQRRLEDPLLAQKVSRATRRAMAKRRRALRDPEWRRWREEARSIKLHTLTHLDRYLQQFVFLLEERGARVVLARDLPEARQALLDVLEEGGERLIIKGKSMVSEEVGVREICQEEGIDVVETDLGELIVQLDGTGPSHVTAPAVHLSVEDVARIFHDHLHTPIPDELHGLSGESTSEERLAAARVLSLAAREHLRELFLSPALGMTGANFLVASSGSVVLFENEANIRLCSTMPERLVVLTGIEKLLPEDGDLLPFFELLPPSATGQALTTYVSFITDLGEGDTVILLDNGRLDLLGDEEHRDLLACIRCGACMNTCPVYRQVGGHAYGGPYPGPIGMALLPHLQGYGFQRDLPFASTLCGACSKVCPVGIPLHDHILENRARVVQQGSQGPVKRRQESLTWRVARWLLEDPRRVEKALALLRWEPGLPALSGPGKAWGAHHEFPRPARESFRTWWARERGEGEP